MIFPGVRRAIESLYDGRLTITEYRSEIDERTKQTRQTETVTYSNIPCRLSHETVRSAVTDGQTAPVTQVIRLFVGPGVTVKPGSRLTVTQNGISQDYRYSGQPAHYSTHQEIILEMWKQERA